jgi:hypothetical protein
MYATHMFFAGSLRTWKPFTLIQQSWTDPTTLEKRASNTIPTSTDRSAGPPPSFSPNKTVEAVGLSVKHLLMNRLHQFNTCSWVSTPRSLTDTGESYNLEGVGFPHHTLHPCQLTVLCFPQMAPPSLKLTCTTEASSNLRVWQPNSRAASMPPDLYRTLQLCLAWCYHITTTKRVLKDNLGGPSQCIYGTNTIPINLMHNQA